ncbi:MAG: polyribonucleotide nucleotidyltransferase [Candidatus Omnitrophica bacterium]|nr:polyribonucleotide nucleotidyltransferase [Candidatus Omnitrophota bacterium]
MSASISITNIGNSEISFSTGLWAKQANGSVCVSCQDTLVLATVCMSNDPIPGKDFFPLTVEYQEKTYAMGKIPGGFFKKEGRPKDKEILTARLIDRPIRPLFPEGMTNEVQLVVMVLSSDGINDPDVLAINAASCALMISDIPFLKPVAAVRISKLDKDYIVNPSYEQRQISPMDLVVVGTEEKIIMLEGALNEVGETDVLEAIKAAQPKIKELINVQKNLQKEVGKPKKEVPLLELDKDLLNTVKEKFGKKIEDVYGLDDKNERKAVIKEIIKTLTEELVTDESEITESNIAMAVSAIDEEILRNNILTKGLRPDSRALDEIRPIECMVGVLPRTHGSATFLRGQTQALATVTLGSSSDEQFIEALEGESSKHFMLHYSFPPFSVGEVKAMRGPSRRDIGHGALAEKALSPVIPPKEDFPYTIRVVSEILESNGSSSMASACAGSLSLMDAGIPITRPVAGIAIGLIDNGSEYKILTDIAGGEDHHGDMDFKIAGTRNGITAIQLDTKIHGLTYKIIEETLKIAKDARNSILDKMSQAIDGPRKSLSQYAPKIKSFEVDPEKIGAIIGPGGKTIKKIQRDNNVNVDIDDETSMVSVSAETDDDLNRAVQQIMNLVKEIEVGEVYEVKVERIVNFGAFCEIAPGKSGLIHVSELSDSFVKDVNDYLKIGDILQAKVIGVDPQGKIRLSAKQAKPA